MAPLSSIVTVDYIWKVRDWMRIRIYIKKYMTTRDVDYVIRNFNFHIFFQRQLLCYLNFFKFTIIYRKSQRVNVPDIVSNFNKLN